MQSSRFVKVIPTIGFYILIASLSLVIVITLRILVPIIVGIDDDFIFRQFQVTVIKTYIAVIGLIVIIIELLYLSICVIYMTTEWMALVYIPLMIYAMIWTHATCLGNLLPLKALDQANDILLKNWLNFIELNETLWIDIQIKLGCCGLDGPSTYLEYMRKVHWSCFANNSDGTPRLVTRGCNDVANDQFKAVQLVAIVLGLLALAIELIAFLLYLSFMAIKWADWSCASARRKYDEYILLS